MLGKWSGDITWHSMIENCCKTKKPILIATGASNLIEIEMAANLISKYTKNLFLCNAILIMDQKIILSS